MTKLYVLYDPKCELCCRLKNWILVQRTWIGIALVPAGSEKAFSGTRKTRGQGRFGRHQR